MPSMVGVMADSYNKPASGGGLPVTAGLVGWYDADDASTFTLTGALVEQWRDKSVKAITLNAPSSALRPSRSGTQNGKPTVVFNSHVVRSAVPAPAICTTGVTIIAACKRSAASASFNCLPAAITASNAGRPLDGHTASLFINITAHTGYVNMGTDTTLKSWATLTNTAAVGDTTYQYLNGVQTNTRTVATAWTTTNQLVGIGMRADNATAFLGEVAEVVVYDVVLTTTERQQVEAYLKTKWGTA